MKKTQIKHLQRVILTLFKLVSDIKYLYKLMEDREMIAKGRDFICSCGKNYLSYAALFTHIKQKHDGKAPGPIVRPRSERKRGRPRKNPQNLNEMSPQNSNELKDKDEVIQQAQSHSNQSINEEQKSKKNEAYNYQKNAKEILPINGERKRANVILRQNYQQQTPKLEKKQNNIIIELKNKAKNSIEKIFEGREQTSSFFLQSILHNNIKGACFYDSIKDSEEGNMFTILQSFLMFLKGYFQQSQVLQIKILFFLFFQYLLQIKKAEDLKNQNIESITKYFNDFVGQWLPNKIEKQEGLSQIHILKEWNPSQMFLVFQNWIVLEIFKQNGQISHNRSDYHRENFTSRIV